MRLARPRQRQATRRDRQNRPTVDPGRQIIDRRDVARACVNAAVKGCQRHRFHKVSSHRLDHARGPGASAATIPNQPAQGRQTSKVAGDGRAAGGVENRFKSERRGGGDPGIGVGVMAIDHLGEVERSKDPLFVVTPDQCPHPQAFAGQQLTDKPTNPAGAGVDQDGIAFTLSRYPIAE